MEGFIKLTTVNFEDHVGVAAEVSLKDVNMLDKAALLDAFIEGLKMDEEEFGVVCSIRGLIQGMKEKHVLKDNSKREEPKSPTFKIEIK